MDMEAIQQDWARRGFSCGLWIDPPGQVWRDYTHPADELLMVMEGELELEIDGRTLRPRLGEEVFIPARARHTVRNVGGGTARWLYGYRR
ncbi:cupin domain-containing protein [Thermithiobacillus tepidarius DSM 3134]|uniref:cupin domain-containing protein n=1 Tax=Thermithiobacillus tepidarius TaxID=929 RepID=UPI00040698C0|nr:cupin domain-containing protein [Thermithiobacillus tepidarius]